MLQAEVLKEAGRRPKQDRTAHRFGTSNLFGLLPVATITDFDRSVSPSSTSTANVVPSARTLDAVFPMS